MSKWQDISINDSNLKAEFITRFFNGDYISAFRIIEDNPQLNTKAFLANVMNEISNLLSLLQNNFQSNVIDYLANELDGFNNLINEFNLKGSWDSETTYEIYNFVIYNDIDYLYINPTPSSGNLPTNTNYWLEINIRGKTGEPGLGVNLKYDWDSTIEYQPLDVVYYDNALWVATATNVNKRPDDNSGTIWQTLTGNIITFTNNNELVIQDIDVNFSPVQDLNGYDAPWPLGGGKNKLFVDTVVHDASTAEIVLWEGSLTGTYTLSADVSGITTDLPNAGMLKYIVDGTQTIRVSKNNPQETITGTITKVSAVAATSYSKWQGTCKFQMEEGSTPTAWMPSSNICPISGWTGATVKRTGKNMLSLDASEATITGWNVSFPFTIKAGTYILSCQRQFGGTTNKGASVSLRDASNNNLLTFTGYQFGNSEFVGIARPVTEEIAAKTTAILFGCTEAMDSTKVASIIDAGLQLELGSTASDYEEYNGDSVTLTWGAVGKNLFSSTIEQGSIASATGEETSSTARCRSVGYIPVKPNTTYTVSAVINGYTSGANRGIYVYEYTADSYYPSGWQAPSGVTFTTHEDTLTVRFVFGKSQTGTTIPNDISNVQLELGSSATSYEPYTNTVYGGTASDNGDGTWTVTVDRQFVANIEKATKYTDTNGYYWYSTLNSEGLPAIKGTNAGFLCNRMIANSNVSTNTTDGQMSAYANGIMRWKEQGNMTQEEYRTWLLSNPLQFVYELAEPITFTVSGGRLNTLVGVNNVWADTNDDTTIELAQKYWEIFLPFKLIKIYSNTTAPSGDDLYNGVIWFEMLTS